MEICDMILNYFLYSDLIFIGLLPKARSFCDFYPILIVDKMTTKSFDKVCV